MESDSGGPKRQTPIFDSDHGDLLAHEEMLTEGASELNVQTLSVTEDTIRLSSTAQTDRGIIRAGASPAVRHSLVDGLRPKEGFCPALTWRRNEEVATARGEDVLRQALARKAALHGLEALDEISLKAGEDQSAVTITPVVAVATTHHGRRVTPVRGSESYVGVKGGGFAVGVSGEVRLLFPRRAIEPSPFPPTSDDAFLLVDRVPVPEVRGEPHDTYHLVAPALGPVRLTLPRGNDGTVDCFPLSIRIAESFREMKRITRQPLTTLGSVLFSETADPPTLPPRRHDRKNPACGIFQTSPTVTFQINEHVTMGLRLIQEVSGKDRHRLQMTRPQGVRVRKKGTTQAHTDIYARHIRPADNFH